MVRMKRKASACGCNRQTRLVLGVGRANNVCQVCLGTQLVFLAVFIDIADILVRDALFVREAVGRRELCQLARVNLPSKVGEGRG